MLIVTSVCALVLALSACGSTNNASGGIQKSSTATSNADTTSGRGSTIVFFRPVLCYAPNFTVVTGRSPDAGPLPTCAAASQLTAANLAVNVSTGQATQNPPADPQFAAYPSTSPLNDTKSAMVLLPALPGQGTGRYVLGPAQVTGFQIKSANASLTRDGQWTVNVTFSASGATDWDTLGEQQFHAIIGIDLNGQVISAPITQPSQTTFTSFAGQVQISGSFNKHQAMTLAGEL
jgi:hypothetical protein